MWIQRMRDGRIWESIEDAAIDAGVKTSMMRKHLNEEINNINGDEYITIDTDDSLKFFPL